MPCTAKLRPIRQDRTLWQDERHKLAPPDHAVLLVAGLEMPAPTVEGTYVLEVETAWEPVPGPESTRLRTLGSEKRRKPSAAASLVRRLTLAVLGPEPATTGTWRRGRSTRRSRRSTWRGCGAIGRWPAGGHRCCRRGVPPGLSPRRPWSRRPPRPVAGLDRAVGDRGGEPRPGDAAGLAWSALGLKVAQPGRPHRLTVTVGGGYPAVLGVALIDSPGQGGGDGPGSCSMCARAGRRSSRGGPAASFAWMVWPTTRIRSS